MPRLLRGVARTAVIAGTASAVGGRVQRRQAERFADRDAQIYADRETAYEAQMAAPTAQPAATAQPDMLEQLERLGALKEQGVLTDEEFTAQKARILGL